MPDVETVDTAPSPAESAAASNVLSGGAELPLAAGAGGAALAPPMAPANQGMVDDEKHSRVGQFFHAALDTLAPKATAPAMGPDGQITEQPVHRSGGDWARRIIAGALTGAASGAAAPVHPGAGAVAGLGAGFMGEQESLERQDATQRANLQRNFTNQQASKKAEQEAQTAAGEAQLRQAQTAYYTTQNTSLGFELSRRKVEAGEEAVKNFNTFAQTVAAQPDNVELGVFPDMNAVLVYRKEHPELVKQIAGNHDSGQILAVPNLVQGADGNWTYQGVRAAIVHPDLMERPAAEFFGGADKIPPISYFIPGKMGADGKMQPGTWGSFQPAPSTPAKDILPWIMKGNADAAKDALQMHHEAVATTGEELSNQIKERELAGQGGTGGPVDEIGRPLPALDPDPEKSNKMRETRRTAFDKDYVKDANQLEQSYKQMGSILDRAANGQMTGADSVVGLFNAVGISSAPLKGRGFRINQNIVGEHVGARNIFQTAAAKLSALTPNGSGELVTPAQLRSYQTILGQARHDMYVSMAQEADRQGLAKDFLPRAATSGKPVDLSTAKIYLDAYGGNTGLARQALGKFGWTVPSAQAQASQTVQ